MKKNAKNTAKIRSLLERNKFLTKQLEETNKNWTDTISYYERRLVGARKMVLDLRSKTPKSIAKGTLYLISELLRSEKEIMALQESSPIKELENGENKQ
jgi:hypothetical protein